MLDRPVVGPNSESKGRRALTICFSRRFDLILPLGCEKRGTLPAMELPPKEGIGVKIYPLLLSDLRLAARKIDDGRLPLLAVLSVRGYSAAGFFEFPATMPERIERLVLTVG